MLTKLGTPKFSRPLYCSVMGCKLCYFAFYHGQPSAEVTDSGSCSSSFKPSVTRPPGVNMGNEERHNFGFNLGATNFVDSNGADAPHGWTSCDSFHSVVLWSRPPMYTVFKKAHPNKLDSHFPVINTSPRPSASLVVFSFMTLDGSRAGVTPSTIRLAVILILPGRTCSEC